MIIIILCSYVYLHARMAVFPVNCSPPHQFSLGFSYLLSFWDFRWMSRSLSAVLWLPSTFWKQNAGVSGTRFTSHTSVTPLFAVFFLQCVSNKQSNLTGTVFLGGTAPLFTSLQHVCGQWTSTHIANSHRRHSLFTFVTRSIAMSNGCFF